MTEFISKVENTCKLKLHIPLDIINPKFKNNDRRKKRLPKNKETFIKYI